MNCIQFRPVHYRAALLACAAAVCVPIRPALAQQAADEFGEEEIVVEGQRPRGSVVGDYQPEVTLNAGDVRALGVSSIAELLEELEPQTQSGGGGSPVVLLEGRRISSFREIGTIPTEAIQRVEILPEEVALKYGYSATQKVVNIVLRQRFRAYTMEGRGDLGTRGDGLGLNGKAGFLAINRGQRVNLDANYSQKNAITEADRGLATDGGDGTDRTLSPETQALTLTGTWAKPLSNVWIATVNGELSTNDSRSLRGGAVPSVVIPGGSPYSTGPDDVTFVPEVDGLSPLAARNSRQAGHLGLTVNGTTQVWQWSLIGNYDHTYERAISRRPLDLASYAAAVAAGDPLANPALPLAPEFLDFQPANHSSGTTDSADLNLIGTVSPLRLPAGSVTTTLQIGGSSDRSDGTVTQAGITQDTGVGRDQGQASINIDIPISSRSVPLFPGAGRISINGNAAVKQVGGFGTLRTLGGGLNWNPTSQFSVIASYRDDQNAPSAAQIGSAVITTPNFEIFDYTTGQSVRVTAVTGGNPNLGETSVRNFRLGASFRLNDPGIALNLDYNRTWQRGQVMALPGATPDVIAAFPDRFLRDDAGDLIGVDLRPINVQREDRSQLRMGITFTKALKTPQSQIDAMRESFRRRFPNGFPGRPEGGPGDGGQDRPEGDGPPPPPEAGDQGSGSRSDSFGGAGASGLAQAGSGGEGSRAGGPGAGPGGGRGGFGPGGFGGRGGRGGRLMFAAYHTWIFSDRAVLANGQPEIDLLNGGTLGAGSGGTPRHQVELQAGFSQSGLGARLTGEWQSATKVNGVAGYPESNLKFDDFATFDLRLFADLGQRPKLVEQMPFLRGSRVTFAVSNIFDARQHVTDGNGNTPRAYQPYYMDPVGRSFQISFRKLFFTRPPAPQR